MKTEDIQTIRSRMAIGKKPQFMWGTVKEVHTIGDYVILEYDDPSEGKTLFYGYVGAENTSVSHETLDQALVYVITYKNLGCSSASAMSHAICKILEFPNG